MSFPVTVKNEEETEKDDRSHSAADNSCCPSPIVLAIGSIDLLAEWVSRIEGMRACDLAGTGSTVVTTRCREPLDAAILALAVS